MGFLSKQKVSIPRLKQKQKEFHSYFRNSDFPGVLIKTKSYKFGQKQTRHFQCQGKKKFSLRKLNVIATKKRLFCPV